MPNPRVKAMVTTVEAVVCVSRRPEDTQELQAHSWAMLRMSTAIESR